MRRHQLLARLWNDDAGQDLIEYALLAAFISVSVIATILNIGPSIEALYAPIPDQLP